MKIFVGGMKRHHQDNLQRAFPDVDFRFATYDDQLDRWLQRARHADHVIIDQSRCSHKYVMHLQRFIRTPIYFTDSKARIREIIQEICTYGEARHSYAGVQRGKGPAQSSGQPGHTGSGDRRQPRLARSGAQAPAEVD